MTVENVVTYLMLLLVIFLVLYIFEFLIKDKKNNLGTTRSFQFIVRKYDLSMNKNRVKILTKLVILVNSFVLSIPLMIVISWDINYYLLLLVSLLVFIFLILILYNLLGYILKKKGW